MVRLTETRRRARLVTTDAHLVLQRHDRRLLRVPREEQGVSGGRFRGRRVQFAQLALDGPGVPPDVVVQLVRLLQGGGSGEGRRDDVAVETVQVGDQTLHGVQVVLDVLGEL